MLHALWLPEITIRQGQVAIVNSRPMALSICTSNGTPALVIAHRTIPSVCSQSRSLSLRSSVNFTHFLQKWPKIKHSSPKCLQQSMTFQKSSFSCPAILTCESDGVSHPPLLGEGRYR
jgi:hypothetical protein